MALEEKLPTLVATATELARIRSLVDTHELLSSGNCSLVRSGYQSTWDGGYDLYTLVVEVPPKLFVRLADNKSELESEIKELLFSQTRHSYGEEIAEVVISPLAGLGEPDNLRKVEDDDPQSLPFWRDGHFRLFLSHLSTDKLHAHGLKRELELFHISAFVAHDDLQVTVDWQNEIETALRTMDALAALISLGFVSSPWCDQEVGYALGRQRVVIGLRYGADPHGFIGKYQGLLVVQKQYSDVARVIFDSLLSHPSSSSRMTDALVHKLVSADSFAEAQAAAGLLENVGRLNSNHVRLLKDAIELNIQVRDAFGVPQKIASIVDGKA